MSIKISELTFLKYYAKRYSIPVPDFIEDSASKQQIKNAFELWGRQAIVKPDVLKGKRGKAGAMAHVQTINDLYTQMHRIGNMQIDGKYPRAVYLVRYIPAIYEIYTAVTYNTSLLKPSMTISLNGGADIEMVPEDGKITLEIDVFKGLDAYQVSEALTALGCRREFISIISRRMTALWDMFISTGMKNAEINPWRVTEQKEIFACDFKGVIDQTNYKSHIPGIVYPEYPEELDLFADEMSEWNKKSYQGQATVSALKGRKILPILFGGGASSVIIDTLDIMGGEPMFLSDFGGNPPYERMYGSAMICFKHHLKDARLLLILGGNANNTDIDITFKAIADALSDYTRSNGKINIPVVIGRGGPKLVAGINIIRQTLIKLGMPHVIFGHDTPVSMVAGYAARLVSEFERIQGEC